MMSTPWVQPYSYPLNLTVVEWEGGYGNTTPGSGNFGQFSFNMAPPGLFDPINLTPFSIASYLGLPKSFPYLNNRPLVLSASGDHWINMKATIYGTSSFGDLEPFVIPNLTSPFQMTDFVYHTITDVVLQPTYAEPPPEDSKLLFDMGYYGWTNPIELDPRCSSWVVSLQVNVSSDPRTVNYSALGDNMPLNIITNRPSIGNNGQLCIRGGDVAEQPSPNLGGFVIDGWNGVTASQLKMIQVPYGNITVSINQAGTADEGVATIILLQDSRWQN